MIITVSNLCTCTQTTSYINVNINELKNEFYSDWLASDRLCVFYKGGVSGREPRII